jgi:DNA-binding NarL/FixJ family response regulator
MIVVTNSSPESQVSAPAWHRAFVAMLPHIRQQAQRAFRLENPEAQEDMVAEVLASAYVAFVRLAQRGQLDRAFSTTLAQYAIRQTRSGRCVGGRLNLQDVSARRTQLAKRIKMDRLDQFDAERGEWRYLLVEDKHAGPAETAIARMDIAAWFRSLSCRQRRIAQALARGETTHDVARKFGLTPGRISQLRASLQRSWSLFQHEPTMT